ncbi:MAG: hypothetical protein KGI54_15055 [Pseudomonadota bacterium]|nr:hypothetical protein [Pseudomonadota bacterium]
MKANWCGSLTEQKMFKVGYMTSKERQAARIFGQKCSNCKHMKYVPGTKRVRCMKHNFAITINATCREWEGR